jgi:hypothetical protein
MCCGSRRAAWQASAHATTSSLRPAAPPAASTLPPSGARPSAQRGAFPTAPLRYEAADEVQVRGPVTGRAYKFTPAEPVQRVDARDAVVFLRSKGFRPA